MPTSWSDLGTSVLTRAAARAQTVLSRRLAEAGSSPFEYRVLTVLAGVEHRTQADLGRAAALDRSDVTATVRLRPGEVSVDRGAPEGQIASIDLGLLEEQLDYPIATGGYGLLASEDPPAAERPAAPAKPEINYGPHLSYSLQWYAFAFLVFVAFGYAARQHVRNEEWDRAYSAEVERKLAQYYDAEGNYTGDVDEELIIRELQMADDMPAHLKSLYRPKKNRRTNAVTNEDEEDALLDALESQRRS